MKQNNVCRIQRYSKPTSFHFQLHGYTFVMLVHCTKLDTKTTVRIRLKGRYDKDLLDMDTSVEHRTYIHLIIRLNILKEEPTH